MLILVLNGEKKKLKKGVSLWPGVCVNVGGFLGRLILTVLIFKIVGPRGPVLLLLYTAKQWSVAMGMVNNVSTFC